MRASVFWPGPSWGIALGNGLQPWPMSSVHGLCKSVPPAEATEEGCPGMLWWKRGKQHTMGRAAEQGPHSPSHPPVSLLSRHSSTNKFSRNELGSVWASILEALSARERLHSAHVSSCQRGRALASPSPSHNGRCHSVPCFSCTYCTVHTCSHDPITIMTRRVSDEQLSSSLQGNRKRSRCLAKRYTCARLPYLRAGRAGIAKRERDTRSARFLDPREKRPSLSTVSLSGGRVCVCVACCTGLSRRERQSSQSTTRHQMHDTWADRPIKSQSRSGSCITLSLHNEMRHSRRPLSTRSSKEREAKGTRQLLALLLPSLEVSSAHSPYAFICTLSALPNPMLFLCLLSRAYDSRPQGNTRDGTNLEAPSNATRKYDKALSKLIINQYDRRMYQQVCDSQKRSFGNQRDRIAVPNRNFHMSP